VRALPSHLADHAGQSLGAIAHRPLGVRRDVVEANLRRAFPDASEEWVSTVARKSFRHLGREAVATLRLSLLDAAAVVRGTEVRGWDAFAAAVAKGRGALLVTGHFGNWEVGAAAVAARGLPMHAVVKRQRNRLFDAWLNAARERLGVGTIDMGKAPTRVPRVLRAGHVVGIVADQDARHSGVWVPFFGHPASTHRGPALFALRLRTPIFACSVQRIPGPVPYRVTFLPVAVPRSGDLERDVLELTRRLAAHLEAAVRAAPEQYFWFHKRWKTKPSAELAPAPPGTTPRRIGQDDLDYRNGNA
jgi:KDO2-lipid IV(A) lauroyltransferase